MPDRDSAWKLMGTGAAEDIDVRKSMVELV